MEVKKVHVPNVTKVKPSEKIITRHEEIETKLRMERQAAKEKLKIAHRDEHRAR